MYYGDGNHGEFCADKHREGSNISFLDVCVFLDNVKEMSVLTLIQCIERIERVLRSTNGKKIGLVTDGYLNECNMSKNELIFVYIFHFSHPQLEKLKTIHVVFLLSIIKYIINERCNTFFNYINS